MGALLSHIKIYGSQECCSDIPSLLWLRRNSIAEASDASSSLIINNKEVSPPQEFLSKYVLCDEEIGVGSTSTVRIVIRREDNVRFACKIIDKEVEATSNGNMIGMEVRVLKLLDHESIIDLIDAFENIHHIFIVLGFNFCFFFIFSFFFFFYFIFFFFFFFFFLFFCISFCVFYF